MVIFVRKNIQLKFVWLKKRVKYEFNIAALLNLIQFELFILTVAEVEEYFEINVWEYLSLLY